MPKAIRVRLCSIAQSLRNTKPPAHLRLPVRMLRPRSRRYDIGRVLPEMRASRKGILSLGAVGPPASSP